MSNPLYTSTPSTSRSRKDLVLELRYLQSLDLPALGPCHRSSARAVDWRRVGNMPRGLLITLLIRTYLIRLGVIVPEVGLQSLAGREAIRE